MVFSHCVYLMWLDSNWRIHRYVFYWSVRSVNLYLTLPDRKKERLSVLVSIKKVTYEQSIFLGSVCASRLSLDYKAWAYITNKKNKKTSRKVSKFAPGSICSRLHSFVVHRDIRTFVSSFFRLYTQPFVYIIIGSFHLRSTVWAFYLCGQLLTSLTRYRRNSVLCFWSSFEIPSPKETRPYGKLCSANQDMTLIFWKSGRLVT